LREECLSEHVFVSLDDPRRKIEQWRIEYNRERPHSSLGNLIPEEFAARAANPGSPALARTARPKQEVLAATVHNVTALDPRPNSFSGHSQGAVKGDPKNYKRN
jgi:hypothetical protein